MFTHSKWRFIDSGIGTAEWNMAVDEALLNGCTQETLPTLRLYGWESALSLGRFSKFSKNLHPEKVEAEKISYVRRISGGGILVHGGDLSYTLILSRDSLRDIGVKESYRYLCGFLIRLYKKFLLQAHYVYDTGCEQSVSAVCLAGKESYDIVINGQKIGGNAQRYTRLALFQHGTIPMRIDVSRFSPLFRGDSGLVHAATLEKLGIFMEYAQLSSLVQEAFSETFGVHLNADTLTQREKNQAQELLAEKYSQERWNLHGQCVAS